MVTESGLAEEVLVRRVVFGVCAVALLTVPVVHGIAGGFESSLRLPHLLALLVGLAALGLGRLRLRAGVAVLGTLLLGVVLVTIHTRTAATFDGTSDGVGLGTGLLWLTAGLAPIVALVLPPRRLLAVGTGVVLLAALVAGWASGGQWSAVVRHPGVAQLLLGVVVLLATTTVVAWLVRHTADERHRALERRREAADRVARLDAEQQERQRMFSATAVQLRVPMEELVGEAHALRDSSSTIPVAALERIEALAATMRVLVVEELDGIVGALRPVDEQPSHAGGDEVMGRLPRAGVLALVTLAVGFVLLDAWQVPGLVATGQVDPHAVSAAANRMVTAVFVATAVLVVWLRGPRGWALAAAVVLLHPVTVAVLVPPSARGELLAPYLTAARMAILAAALLALLAEVVARRVDQRIQLDRATAAAAVQAVARQHRDARVERAYAEAAHELKNPLAVIGGAAGTLRLRASHATPDQLATLRSAVVRSVDRLDGRLRAMDTVAGGHPDPAAQPEVAARRPLAVAEVIDRALTSALEGVDPAPVLDIARLDGETTIPPDDLDQVLENLVGNARKHGDPTTVRVVVRPRADHVVLTVANRGGHLPEQGLARVFEPYWRAEGTGTGVEGAGLGLAIVSRLVTGWGGRRWLTVEGGWTTVGVTIPTTTTPVASRRVRQLR